MKSVIQKQNEANERARKRALLSKKQQLVIIAKRPGLSARETRRLSK